MGFLKGIRDGMRREGVWLDADQTRVLVRLIHRGYATGYVPFTREEAQLFSRLVERCREFDDV